MASASEQLPASVRAGIWALIAVALLPTWTDPDLWGHVRFGLDFLRDHRLPRIDPYSFTQDRPWINHEWLSEALSAAAYVGLGGFGLALLKAAVLVPVLILVKGALHRSPAAIRLVALLLVFWAGLGITLTVRPQIWSWLLTAILCRLLLAGTPRALRYLPLIFLVWANLHGGWIVGLGVLVIWTAAVFASGTHAPNRGALVAAIACSVVATLVNPYGWRLWEFLASTVRLGRVDVIEWQPLWIMGVAAWIPWLATLAAVIVLAFRRGRQSILPPLMVSAMLGYASLRVARLSPFFVLTSAILWAPHIASMWPSSPQTARRSPAVPSAVAAALFLCTVAFVAHQTVRTAMCLPIVGDWSPDRPAGAALKAAEAHGRLVTWFGWGEYALWQLSPNLKISIDGRRETIYSDDVLRRHVAIYEQREEGFAEIERWHPEYIWLPAHLTLAKSWLESHGYRIDVSTKRSYVAVRRDLPRIVPVALNTPSCFPG